jgi:uncharacterized protein involved in type VI secretion and phage assembly
MRFRAFSRSWWLIPALGTGLVTSAYALGHGVRGWQAGEEVTTFYACEQHGRVFEVRTDQPPHCPHGARNIFWNTGSSGASGPTGPAGPAGPAGERGAPGAQGSTGPAGSIGPTGPTGPQGAPGIQGTQGVAGPTGPRGLRGETGATGAQGEPGIAGQSPAQAFLELAGDGRAAPFEPLTCLSASALEFHLGGLAVGRVLGFTDDEAVSENYEIRVVLSGANVEPPFGAPGEVVFKHDGASSSFQGFVEGASAIGAIDGESVQLVRLVSKLALLRDTRYRSFTRASVRNITDALVQTVGMTASVTGGDRRWEQVTQFGESDLDFLKRITGREGLFFRFQTPNALAVSNVNSSLPVGPTLQYVGHAVAPAGTGALRSFGRVAGTPVASWSVFEWDYGAAEERGATASGPVGGIGSRTLFLPGGGVATQEGLSAFANAMRDWDSGRESLYLGTSASPDVRAGVRVGVVGSGGAFDGEYVVTRVRHVATAGAECVEYGNRLSAIPAGIPVRTRPDAALPGLEGRLVNAFVTTNVDHDNPELFRVKVRFHWSNDLQSPWARVLTTGATPVALPAIGDEVLVGFQGGDPDFPFVIGPLFNGQRRAP